MTSFHLDGLRIGVVRWGRLSHMRNVSTLANALSRYGAQVTVITMEGTDGSASGLVPAVKWVGLDCDRKKMGPLRAHSTAGWRLARMLRAGNYDLAYVVDSWTLPAFSIARVLVPTLRRKPWVYHTFDWMDPGSHPIHERLERKACHGAGLVVNVDRSRARMMQAFYGLKSLPVVLPNYLSLAESVPPRDETLRKALFPEARNKADGILLCYPTVAATSRLTMELISSLPCVDDRAALLTFAVDSEYGRACRRKCDELGVRHRVLFHEPVSYARLMAMVAACDAGAIFHDQRVSSGYFMCNPDRLSLFAACGIPFVGTDVPNMESLVYRHGLGFCCNPADPAAISSALNRLLAGEGMSLERRKLHVRECFEKELHFERHEGPWLESIGQLVRQ